jgi:hypothetical protein
MARTLIEPHERDKRYVRRKKGRFTKKQVAVGRSLAADRRSKSRTIAKKGEGDRGDQKRRKTKRKTARKTKRKRR